MDCHPHDYPATFALRPYIEIARPGRLLTAPADVAAGFLIAGSTVYGALPGLLLATLCLYASGTVLNDVFDADSDSRRRAARPIARGDIGRGAAAVFGLVLLALGIAYAYSVSDFSGAIALIVAALALTYNAGAKHTPAGPTLIGLCRGANLLLGMSAGGAMPDAPPWPAAILALYVAAVATLNLHRHSGLRQALFAGGVGIIASAALTGWVCMQSPHGYAMWFWWVFVGAIAPAAAVAAVKLDSETAHEAVRYGVLGVIALDAALTAAYVGAPAAFAVLALLPLALYFSYRFAAPSALTDGARTLVLDN